MKKNCLSQGITVVRPVLNKIGKRYEPTVLFVTITTTISPQLEIGLVKLKITELEINDAINYNVLFKVEPLNIAAVSNLEQNFLSYEP